MSSPPTTTNVLGPIANLDIADQLKECNRKIDEYKKEYEKLKKAVSDVDVRYDFRTDPKITYSYDSGLHNNEKIISEIHFPDLRIKLFWLKFNMAFHGITYEVPVYIDNVEYEFTAVSNLTIDQQKKIKVKLIEKLVGLTLNEFYTNYVNNSVLRNKPAVDNLLKTVYDKDTLASTRNKHSSIIKSTKKSLMKAVGYTSRIESYLNISKRVRELTFNYIAIIVVSIVVIIKIIYDKFFSKSSATAATAIDATMPAYYPQMNPTGYVV